MGKPVETLSAADAAVLQRAAGVYLNGPKQKITKLLGAVSRAKNYTVMASPPAVTKGTVDANSTVVTNVDRYNPTYLPTVGTPLGCANITGSSGNYGANYITEISAPRSSGWGIGLWMDGEAVEVCARDLASAKMRVRVDGEWISASDTDISGTGAGTSLYIKLDWGTGNGRPRYYEWFFTGGAQIRGFTSGFSAGSTKANNRYKAWAGPDRSAVKAMWFGDSYAYGVGLVNNTVRNSLVHIWGEALGIPNPIASGVGGQGYLALSNNGAKKARDRITDISVAGELDLLMLGFGINDFSQTAATLQAEVTTTVAAAMAAQPNAIILGTFFTASGKIVGSTQAAALKAGFLAAYDPMRMAWLEGGEARQDVSGGNSTIYQNADNVHPNDAGHEYLGRRCGAETIVALQSIRDLQLAA